MCGFGLPKLAAFRLLFQFINRFVDPNPWNGWKRLWSLKMIPRVKHFLWLTFLGRLSTTDFFHSINLGPQSICIFCNLYLESPEHLLHTCCKSQSVWILLSHLTSKQIQFTDGFNSGTWITQSLYSKRIKIIIAYAAWFLWEARCDAIFHNINPNFYVIAHKALSYANENICGHENPICRKLILTNFACSDGLFLFSASSRNDQRQVGYGGAFCFFF